MEFLAYSIIFTLAGSLIYTVFEIGVFYGEERAMEEIYGRNKQTAP